MITTARTKLRLSDVLREVDVRAGSVLADLPVLSLTKDHGLIPQSDRFKQRVARDDVSGYKVIRRGQIAHNPYVLWEGAIHSLKNIEAGLVSPVYSVWETRDCVDPSYIDLLLRTPAMLRRYEQLASGAVKRRRTISTRTFLSIEIELPRMDEQLRAVAALSAIQTASACQRITQSSLDSMRKSLARSLFFDPAWRHSPLGDQAKITSGGTPSRSIPEFWGGRIPWVKTSEVNYSVILTTGESITEAGLAGSSAKVYPAGTVLMAMYGEGATRGRVARLGIEAAVNQACAAIIPGPELDPSFLYHYLAHSYDAMRSMSHGSHQKNLSASLLKRFPVPLPEQDVQLAISRQLEAIDARFAMENIERQRLNEFFDSALTYFYQGVQGSAA